MKTQRHDAAAATCWRGASSSPPLPHTPGNKGGDLFSFHSNEADFDVCIFFPFFFFLLPLPIKRVTDEVMEAVWPGSAGEKNECEAEAREMDG